ncbi:MAG: pyridoxamine 5'-phosphate oxidase family protein [Syntrophaceae bacterium]
MENRAEIEALLKELFASQQFAVLATQDKGQPYVSLMAFAHTEDLEGLIVATDRGTRKFTNLLSNTRVAVMIDNRSNRGTDTETATAVTILGQALELSGEERERHLAAYVRKYPHLSAFARSQKCALIRIAVESYYVVSGLYDVRELHFKA